MYTERIRWSLGLRLVQKSPNNASNNLVARVVKADRGVHRQTTQMKETLVPG